VSVLGILGTVHSDEMRKEYNYSLEKMRGLIEQFKPDIICGEVRPEDWEKYCNDTEYNGYLGPNEYRRLIIPLCEKTGIKFIPVDWFEDDMVNMDYFKGKSELEVNNIENQLESIMNVYMEVAKNSIVPFNSLDFNNIVEKKQAFQNSINPEVHSLYWTCRNQLMVYRIKEVLSANKGKRVLCTVGAEHTYFYCKQLQEADWEIIYPLK
jgi:hypothetical protein